MMQVKRRSAAWFRAHQLARNLWSPYAMAEEDARLCEARVPSSLRGSVESGSPLPRPCHGQLAVFQHESDDCVVAGLTSAVAATLELLPETPLAAASRSRRISSGGNHARADLTAGAPVLRLSHYYTSGGGGGGAEQGGALRGAIRVSPALHAGRPSSAAAVPMLAGEAPAPYIACGSRTEAANRPQWVYPLDPTPFNRALAAGGAAQGRRRFALRIACLLPGGSDEGPLCLLDIGVHGPGAYFLYLGTHDVLSLTIGAKAFVTRAQLQRCAGPHEMRYTLHPLPPVAPAEAQEGSKGRVQAQAPIGVNVTVYRSNYRSIAEKALREANLAQQRASEAERLLEKTERTLGNWRKRAVGEARLEKGAQEAAGSMSPADGSFLVISNSDESVGGGDLAPVRERLDERLSGAEEALAALGSLVNGTLQRTIERLRRTSRRYTVARRRQNLLNRARGLRGLRVPALDRGAATEAARKAAEARRTLRTLRRTQRRLQAQIDEATRERQALLEEARELALERMRDAEALAEKRKKADRRELDFKIDRLELEEDRLKELERMREELVQLRRETDDVADAAEEQADAAEEQADAAEEQADAAEERADAAEEQAEAAEEQADAAEEQAEAAEDQLEGAEERAQTLEEETRTAQEQAGEVDGREERLYKNARDADRMANAVDRMPSSSSSSRTKHAVYRLRLPNLEDGDNERLSDAEAALIDLIRKRQALGDTIVLDVTPTNSR